MSAAVSSLFLKMAFLIFFTCFLLKERGLPHLFFLSLAIDYVNKYLELTLLTVV
jgi:hypothetical protein